LDRILFGFQSKFYSYLHNSRRNFRIHFFYNAYYTKGESVRAIDFGKLPPITFHAFLLVFQGVFLGCSYAFTQNLQKGILFSSGIQMLFFEIKFWFFRFRRNRSANWQFFVIILSFFVNLGFLFFYGVSQGFEFLVGFFLAFFFFLGTFVLSAILSVRLKSRDS